MSVTTLREAIPVTRNADADRYRGKWLTLSNTTLGMLMALGRTG
jgi:lipocalin